MDAMESHEKLELVLRRLQDGSIKLKDAMREIRMLNHRPREIPVTQWAKYYPWPSVSALRAYIFAAKDYDFERCVIRRHGRVFIDEEEFHAWMERRKQSYEKRR